MNDRKKVKEYLKGLEMSNEDKNFILDFNDKKEYIQNLIEAMEKSTNASFEFGYGNFNSNIALVFKDVDTMNKVQKSMDKILEYANCELWTMYVTFVNKIKGGKGTSIELLYKELYAVSPKVIYVISDTEHCLEKFYDKSDNKKVPKIFKINPDNITDADNIKELNKAWKSFRYMLNYKDKTIR